MIGSGIFALPSQMAGSAAPGPLLIGWAVTGVGMLMLAFVFQTLASRQPEINGGVYGYARASFGNYIGFTSAFGYWMSAWVGNVAYLVLLFSTLGYLFPAFEGGATGAAIIGASIVLWIVHAMTLRGVQTAALVNVVVTVAKVRNVPMAGATGIATMVSKTAKLSTRTSIRSLRRTRGLLLKTWVHQRWPTPIREGLHDVSSSHGVSTPSSSTSHTKAPRAQWPCFGGQTSRR